MFLTYLLRELSNRRKQTVVIAAGIALAIALVIVVSGVAAGVRNAQSSVLESVYGVGTDVTISQTAEPGADGGGPGRQFAFGSGDGTTTDDGSHLGKGCRRRSGRREQRDAPGDHQRAEDPGGDEHDGRDHGPQQDHAAAQAGVLGTVRSDTAGLVCEVVEAVSRIRRVRHPTMLPASAQQTRQRDAVRVTRAARAASRASRSRRRRRTSIGSCSSASAVSISRPSSW